MIRFFKGILKTLLSPEDYRRLKALYHCFFLHGKRRDLRKILERQAQQKTVSGKARVSILCCCFNTRPDDLKEMLDSVLWQTCRNWELCLLDCSDAAHEEVGKILETYAQKDSRVKVIRHDNQGIAMNSNRAASGASGEYLLLLDHDDILPPIAIAELLRAAENGKSDFVYADEYLLFSRGYRVRRKKDFDLERLWHDNYLNHPALIRKSLFDEVGGFRRGFDGSQDYDLYLRLVEKTQNVVHVRKPLYVWRIHDGSFSQRSLQRCIDSGKKALKEHLARTGIKAEVTARRDSAVFKVRKMD